MTRSQPGASGSLLHARPRASGSCTSMKVRVQLIGHHLQTVSGLVVLVYVSASTVSKPRNRLGAPPWRQSAAQSAAPMAPASPNTDGRPRRRRGPCRG